MCLNIQGNPEVLVKGNEEVGLGVSDKFADLHWGPEIIGTKLIQLFRLFEKNHKYPCRYS